MTLLSRSSYQGNFSAKNITEGIYWHFTGLRFKGCFSRDRWKKGVIEFLDGEKLTGIWICKKNKWILKKGTLYDEDNDVVEILDHKTEYCFPSLNKNIYVNHKELGFCIEFDYLYGEKNILYWSLFITADCKT